MTIRERILELLKNDEYRDITKDELINLFGLDRKFRKEFEEILKDLEREGLIILDSNNKYQLVDRDDYLVGKFEGNERGFGFVVPKDREKSDIFISSENMKGAMDGDIVLLEVISKASKNKRSEGNIVKILERKNKRIVGSFISSRKFGFVVPDNKNLGFDIFIPKSKFLGAKNNQKVVVEITKWPENNKNPEGEIREVLGYMSQKGIDILSVAKNFGYEEEFSKDVIREVDNINQEVTDNDIKNRLDLRDERIITIDGFDAKDLDDGISIEKLSNGNYKLGVHIADVSHYVKEGSSIDNEAFERGNSVYLLDRVIPMLPRELSNGICSLNEGEDRLCLSIIMEIDKEGKVVDHKIEESVINNHRRLTYEDVSDFLENGESSNLFIDIAEDLKNMENLALILMKKRKNRGSINFDFPETKIILDKDGKPERIYNEERRIANKIIEEFMLVSNETIAELFYWVDSPFIYRIHEEPDSEKIEEFSKIAYNFGYSIKGIQDIHPKSLQLLLEDVKDSKEEGLISMLLLRSLKKAIYSEYSDIHFGLAADYYTHFTAPIRRYSDLTIHRIIKRYINSSLNKNYIKKLEKKLPEIASHTSDTERMAEEAERNVMDMKIAEYMLQYIGEEYIGIISSLTNFGIFVQLENTVEGLVRFVDMRDDYYHFDENNYIVIGERTGKLYRLGEKVKIRVVDANIAKKTVDFIFV